MFPIQSQCSPLRGVAYSMQGGRPENQDDIGFVDTPLGFLIVLCDGMGGGPGGKTASGLAKNEMARFLCACNPSMPRIDALKEAISRTQDAMKYAMEYNRALTGMGTTLVAMLISRQSAVVAHLGDSRCYRLRNGRMRYRSNDHSLVGELVRNKALSEEEARCSPQSNVITRGLGSVSNNVPEIDEVPYRKGDRFVVCTDGVWGVMPHTDLLHRIAAPVEMNILANNLAIEIDKIGCAGGGHHDNHTFAIMEMDIDSIMKDKMDKTIKIILAVMGALLVISILLNVVFAVKTLTVQNNDVHSIIQPSQNDILVRDYIDKISDESYKKVLVELMESKVALQDENAALYERIESLTKALEALQTKSNTTDVLTQSLANHPMDSNQTVTIIESILRDLRNMRNVKIKSTGKMDVDAKKKASQQINTHRDEVEKLNVKLQNLTGNNFSELDSIKSDLIELKNKEYSICLIDYVNEGYFVPNRTAVGLINKQIERLKRIKSQISC